MSYTKYNEYPSLLKPGIYPDGTIDQLGLGTDVDLEKFSLGNWNSIVKNNRTFFSPLSSVADLLDEESGYAGRPIRITLEGKGQMKFFYQRIVRESDDPWSYDPTGDITEVKFESMYSISDLGNPDTQPFVSGDLYSSPSVNERESTIEWLENNYMSMSAILSENDGFILQNDNFDESLDEHQIPIRIKFEDDVQESLDEILNRSHQVFYHDDSSTTEKVFHYFKVTLDIPTENILGESIQVEDSVLYDGRPVEATAQLVWADPDAPAGWAAGAGESFTIERKPSEDIYAFKLRTVPGLLHDPPNLDLLQSWGHPSYTRNFPLIETNREIDPVDFQVSCFTEEENNLLYYDFKLEKDKFTDTSYPVKVNVGINLFGVISFDNSVTAGNASELIDLFYTIHTDSGSANLTEILEDSRSPEESVYYYEVVQWGDEETLLSDDAFLNTSYFQLYEMEEYPGYNDFNMKLLNQSQLIYSKPIMVDGELNLSSHVYSTPGPKSIKIIVYRYIKDLSILNETILVTKNININDGTLLTQDFEIFGGTDFNFLPLKDREAIIGGLDENSKYSKSVGKIAKDAVYTKDDFLQRKTILDSVEKVTSGEYGKSPGHVDLSTIRIFKGTSDIYDFLMTDDQKDKVISNKFPNFSGSFYGEDDIVKFNSETTDIFINDGDSELKQNCMIEINPQKMEYLTIPNTVGNKDKGILIGDFEVKKEKNQPIRKDGIMQTPLLEDWSEEQAF